MLLLLFINHIVVFKFVIWVYFFFVWITGRRQLLRVRIEFFSGLFFHFNSHFTSCHYKCNFYFNTLYLCDCLTIHKCFQQAMNPLTFEKIMLASGRKKLWKKVSWHPNEHAWHCSFHFSQSTLLYFVWLQVNFVTFFLYLYYARFWI